MMLTSKGLAASRTGVRVIRSPFELYASSAVGACRAGGGAGVEETDENKSSVAPMDDADGTEGDANGDPVGWGERVVELNRPRMSLTDDLAGADEGLAAADSSLLVPKMSAKRS